MATDERDPRPEGVYCKWENYPLPDLGYSARLLTIERVNGDCTVSRLTCTTDEAAVIYRSIWEECGHVLRKA